MQLQIYLSYREDDLASVASMGLVRRAKKSLAEVVAPDNLGADPLCLSVAGQWVKLPSAGITHAECDCTALGICKHILSAVLWLQDHVVQADTIVNDVSTNSQDTASATAVQQKSSTTEPIDSAIDDILSLNPTQLMKATPKAARVFAYQLTQTWLQEGGCQLGQMLGGVRFELPAFNVAVRYFKQAGLAGMLSDLPSKQQPALHLACLAYVFLSHEDSTIRAHWRWTEDVQALAATSEGGLSQTDEALIDALLAICLSFVRQGLSHVATSSVTALHLLSLQAQTQNLPRLAAEIRDLHGLLGKYLAGEIHSDEQVLFVRLSRFYAYLMALKAAKGERLSILRGRVRAQYQAGKTLDLMPLGAAWWTTDSGARGLSFCAWDVTAGMMHVVTNARSNALDTTFDCDVAAHTGMWGVPVTKLLCHRMTISQVKISDMGKLSSAQSVQYVASDALAEMSFEVFRRLVPVGAGVFDDWQALQTYVRPTSLIDAVAVRYVFVYLNEMSELTLNEVEQCFACMIRDSNDAWLSITLPVTATVRAQLKKLEYWQHSGGVRGMLLTVAQYRGETIFIPCSLLIDGAYVQKKAGVRGIRLFSLDYDVVPALKKKGLFELVSGRIERLLHDKKAHASSLESEKVVNTLDLLLTRSQHILAFYANTGRQVLDDTDRQTLEGIRKHCQALGLYQYGDSLARLMAQTPAQLPEALLRARFVLYGIQNEMAQLH